MTDFPAEKPPVARAYCPGCEPAADPMREILDVHWCDSHAPCRAGPDDVLATARGTAYGSAEAGGEDNRRWCDLIHRGRRLQERPPQARGDPEHSLEQNVSAERDQEA